MIWLRLIVGLVAAPLALLFEIANWALGVLEWEFKHAKTKRTFVQSSSQGQCESLPPLEEIAREDASAAESRHEGRPTYEILAEWERSADACLADEGDS